MESIVHHLLAELKEFGWQLHYNNGKRPSLGTALGQVRVVRVEAEFSAIG